MCMEYLESACRPSRSRHVPVQYHRSTSLTTPVCYIIIHNTRAYLQFLYSREMFVQNFAMVPVVQSLYLCEFLCRILKWYQKMQREWYLIHQYLRATNSAKCRLSRKRHCYNLLDEVQNFAVFTDWLRTTKITFRQIWVGGIMVLPVTLRHAKIVSAKSLKLNNPRKFCTSKIWRYTVIYCCSTVCDHCLYSTLELRWK